VNIQSERILLLGDSLSHHGSDAEPEIWLVDTDSQRVSAQPGDLLASMLIEAGADAVQIDANVGRSAINFWAGNARFQFHTAADLIAADQAFAPTKLVVFLGTNDLGMDPDLDAHGFQAILDAFPNVEAWAIGPPIFGSAAMNMQAEQVYQTLRNVFGQDRVIDARPLSTIDGRAGDGVHFLPASAAYLASGLLGQLQSSLSFGWTKIAMIGLGVLGLIGAGLWWNRREQRALQGLSGTDDEEDETEHEDPPWHTSFVNSPEQKFKELLREPGADSLEVAEDFAEQHGLKIHEVTKNSEDPHRQGTIHLNDPKFNDPEHPTHIHWSIVRGSSYGKKYPAGGVVTWTAHNDVIWRGTKIVSRLVRSDMDTREYTSADEARDVAIAQAWATAKLLKSLPDDDTYNVDQILDMIHVERRKLDPEAKRLREGKQHLLGSGDDDPVNMIGLLGTPAFKISKIDPKTMAASQINKELDKLSEQSSKLGQEMIDAGRGHERPSEYLKMTDPLSIELRKNSDRRQALRAEIAVRYGPDAPSRLPSEPRGWYGPRAEKPSRLPFQPGDVVTSSYRVDPFLSDEKLTVKDVSNVGKKTKPEWRIFVASNRGPEGWLDAENLTLVENA
jgi:hypothetical protein